MVVLGLVALATPFTVSLGTTVFVGWMILLGGIIELGTTFSARGWQGVLFYLLLGVLDILFGLLVISRPIEALGMFTLFFAAMLFVAGTFRSCMAVFTQAPNWGMTLASGIVSILCGVLIAADWPGACVVWTSDLRGVARKSPCKQPDCDFRPVTRKKKAFNNRLCTSRSGRLAGV
jgi:uncharacterized membrane protein HdeD (DUF308 family)